MRKYIYPSLLLLSFIVMIKMVSFYSIHKSIRGGWRREFPFIRNTSTSIEFVLIRAIGNDLPPRHSKGQSFTNLKFILEHESNLPRVHKRWLLNRIVDEYEEKRIIELLNTHKQEYFRIPFEMEEYIKIPLQYQSYDFDAPDAVEKKFTHDIYHSEGFVEAPNYMKIIYYDQLYHERNLYVINNNGCRNEMLRLGIELGAKWILPFDGNSFFTDSAWSLLLHTVDAHEGLMVEDSGNDNRMKRSQKNRVEIYNFESKSNTDQYYDDAHAGGGVSMKLNDPHSENKKQRQYKYFVVGMERMHDNSLLFDSNFKPSANEEPQIMFHRTAVERFNIHMRYGRRPKVELLWRLGVSGPGWDRLKSKWVPGEVPQRWEVSKDIPCSVDCVPYAGWVARLFSGNRELERSTKNSWTNRARSRTYAVENMMNSLSMKYAADNCGFDLSSLLIFDESVLLKERARYKSKENKKWIDYIDNNFVKDAEAILSDPMSLHQEVRRNLNNINNNNNNNAPTIVDDDDHRYLKSYVSLSRRKKDKPIKTNSKGVLMVTVDPGDERYWNKFAKQVTTLSLAAFITENQLFCQRAADLIRMWFVHSETKIFPDLQYLRQISGGKKDPTPKHNYYSKVKIQLHSIIGVTGFHYVLDAIKLVKKVGGLSASEYLEIQQWMGQMLVHLETEGYQTKKGGSVTYLQQNHIGLQYDLTLTTLSAFVNDPVKFFNYTQLTRSRMFEQIGSDGELHLRYDGDEASAGTSSYRDKNALLSIYYWFVMAIIGEKSNVDYISFPNDNNNNDHHLFNRMIERESNFIEIKNNNYNNNYSDIDDDVGALEKGSRTENFMQSYEAAVNQYRGLIDSLIKRKTMTQSNNAAPTSGSEEIFKPLLVEVEAQVAAYDGAASEGGNDNIINDASGVPPYWFLGFPRVASVQTCVDSVM